MASLKSLATFVALGAVAHAAVPYLPLIGPPPMRVQVIKSPATAMVKFLATSTVPNTNTAGLTESAAIVVPTNTAHSSVSTGSPLQISAASAPAIFPSVPESVMGDTFSGTVFAMPTPDLLGISPQMLATYFHPVQIGTNPLLVAAPFHVTFIPPLPPPAEDHSSHAEYIVK